MAKSLKSLKAKAKVKPTLTEIARRERASLKMERDMTTKIFSSQAYRHIGTEPYTRVDGSTTELAIWESECAKCGKLFTFKYSTASLKFSPNRRCEKHKRPGSKVRRAA